MMVTPFIGALNARGLLVGLGALAGLGLLNSRGTLRHHAPFESGRQLVGRLSVGVSLVRS